MCRPLAGLERHHQINPAGWPLRLENFDEIGSENVDKQLLEGYVDTWQTRKSTKWCALYTETMLSLIRVNRTYNGYTKSRKVNQCQR